jgi:hypothetical protein
VPVGGGDLNPSGPNAPPIWHHHVVEASKGGVRCADHVGQGYGDKEGSIAPSARAAWAGATVASKSLVRALHGGKAAGTGRGAATTIARSSRSMLLLIM